ncbi:MAG: sugar transferase [Candidatus Kapabacteria bacterium]|jgi:exopolysaccharide biosynthesis polyprenyl glycosylphosphotransferase|nr:sugar transferase [Candidatus Kapabacteria bacterium]
MTTISQAFSSSSPNPHPNVNAAEVAHSKVRRKGLHVPRSPRLYQIIFDALSFSASFVVYYLLRFFSGLFETSTSAFTQPLLSDERTTLIVAAVIALYGYWALLFWFGGLYEDWYVRSPFDEFFTIVRITFIGCCILGLLIFLDDIAPAQNPRLLVFLYWVAFCASVCAGRITARYAQRVLRIREIISFPTLLVGSADNVRALQLSVRQAPAFGFHPIGVVMSDATEAEQWHNSAVSDSNVMTKPAQLPLLGVVSEIPKLLAAVRPTTVLVSTATPNHEELLRLANECEKHDITLKVVPDLYEIFSGQTRTQHVYGMALIEISAQIMTPWQRVMKRLMDIVLSLLGIIVGLPVWVAIGVIVALETPGGAMYSQIRIGRGGVPFRIWKFRSMAQGSDKVTGFTQVNDARVTPFGRIIRKTHLDEIPQLWNILKGDMSIVGPRPEVPKLVEKFSQAIPYYPRRHKVRPGLTGWWQISPNYFQYQETIDDIRSRLTYDFYYIENISFRLDIEIIIRTVIKVFKGHGQA